MPVVTQNNIDIYPDEVCETVMRYLPWMLIGSIGTTVILSALIVTLSIGRQKAKVTSVLR